MGKLNAVKCCGLVRYFRTASQLINCKHLLKKTMRRNILSVFLYEKTAQLADPEKDIRNKELHIFTNASPIDRG